MVATTMIPRPVPPVNGRSGDTLSIRQDTSPRSIHCEHCGREMLLHPEDTCDVRKAIWRYSQGCLCKCDDVTLASLIFSLEWAREHFETFRQDGSDETGMPLEEAAAIIHSFHCDVRRAADKSPRLRLLTTGKLLCADRMPEPGDVIDFGSGAYRVDGYDNHMGWIDCSAVTRGYDEAVFRAGPTLDRVRENGVYVSRADGGSVKAKRERPNLTMESPVDWNKYDYYVFNGGKLDYEEWQKAKAQSEGQA